jgi:hypothetical protein
VVDDMLDFVVIAMRPLLDRLARAIADRLTT